MTISYTSKSGRLAREYTAIEGDLHIELDKTNREYLGWCIFIERIAADGDLRITEYHGYAQTLVEAKALAEKFVISRALLASAEPEVEPHIVGVITDYGHKGGPAFRATCSCGWKSWGYVRAHAAQGMADWHSEEVAAPSS